MNPVCRSLAAAACAFWFSAAAFGQPDHLAPTSGFGPFNNPYGRSFQSLADPQVQEELKLTDDQWDKIKRAQEEMKKKMGEVYRSKDINEKDPRKRAQAYHERIQALSDEAEDKAHAILSEKQAERLQQILRQKQMVWGSLGILSVLLDKDVVEKLRLTDDQREQLRRKQADVYQENKRAREAFYSRLLAETREKMFALLTAEQRNQLEGMLGPKFEPRSEAERKAEAKAAVKEAKPRK